MAKTKDHLTVPDLEALDGYHEWKQKYGRSISASQSWNYEELMGVRLRIRGEVINLSIAQARRVGEWLIAATYAKQFKEQD